MSFPTGVEEGAVGSERTLSGFAAEQSVPLTRFAYLLCGDHVRAEDLVQDAFLALFRRYGDDLPLAAPVAYARQTIVNRFMTVSRKRMSSEIPTDDVPDSGAPPMDNAEQDAMWRVLSDLPGRQRAVLVLRYYLDFPDTAIAEILDCRPGTVRSLAARAFSTLRTHPGFAEQQL